MEGTRHRKNEGSRRQIDRKNPVAHEKGTGQLLDNFLCTFLLLRVMLVRIYIKAVIPIRTIISKFLDLIRSQVFLIVL